MQVKKRLQIQNPSEAQKIVTVRTAHPTCSHTPLSWSATGPSGIIVVTVRPETPSSRTTTASVGCAVRTENPMR